MIRHFFYIVVWMTFILSGCSLLSPVKPEPESIYLLNSVPHLASKHTRPITLLVMQPESPAVYNTTQMAYTQKPYQIAYFSLNRWAETPPQMLHLLIVQTLQNAHYFRAVVTPPFTGRFDYVLETDNLQLQQNFTYRHPVVQLSLRIQLIRAATNQIIATKQISIVEPILQNTPYGGVVAANRATERALMLITYFCFSTIKG